MLKPSHLKLIQAGLEIRTSPEPVRDDLAYMARQLVQATLPHTDPGDVEVWKRRNGNLSLVIRRGWDHNQRPAGTVRTPQKAGRSALWALAE